MPVYTVKDTSNDEYTEVNMSYEAFKEYMKENTNLQQVFKMPATVSGSISAHRRAGEGWQDILKKVKKASGKDNTVNV